MLRYERGLCHSPLSSPHAPPDILCLSFSTKAKNSKGGTLSASQILKFITVILSIFMNFKDF